MARNLQFLVHFILIIQMKLLNGLEWKVNHLLFWISNKRVMFFLILDSCFFVMFDIEWSSMPFQFLRSHPKSGILSRNAIQKKSVRIHLILRHRFRHRFDYLNKWGEKCVFIWTLAEQRVTASNWNSLENLCIRAKRWSYVYPFRLCWLAAHCCLYPVQKSNFNATNVS